MLGCPKYLFAVGFGFDEGARRTGRDPRALGLGPSHTVPVASQAIEW